MALKHLSSPGITRLKAIGRRRFISHSASFKKLVAEKRGFLSEAMTLIKRIQAGERMVRGETHGVVVEKLEFAHTNKFNKNLFRVQLNGFEFFVKESTDLYNAAEVAVWNKAKKYLGEIGGGFMGYGVKLVEPHMMIDNYLVSNFYPIKEFVNVESMKPGKFKEELSDTITRLGKNLSKRGVEDVRPRNALYHAPTKTIYLVDLISSGRYSTLEKNV